MAFPLRGTGKTDRGIRQCLHWLMHMPCGMCGQLSIPLTDQKGQARMGLSFLERMRGIEPPLSAWEAGVLPMNYIRV